MEAVGTSLKSQRAYAQCRLAKNAGDERWRSHDIPEVNTSFRTDFRRLLRNHPNTAEYPISNAHEHWGHQHPIRSSAAPKHLLTQAVYHSRIRHNRCIPIAESERSCAFFRSLRRWTSSHLNAFLFFPVIFNMGFEVQFDGTKTFPSPILPDRDGNGLSLITLTSLLVFRLNPTQSAITGS